MALLLRFRIDLRRFDSSLNVGQEWPVFHRWLPNGKEDALTFDMKDSNLELKIWFERWGVVEGGLIEYRSGKQEFDPTIIPTQGYLVAGPLFGQLTISNIPDEDIVLLRENKNDDQRYINLGKKVVKDLIYPPIARFINILRITYGQYWLQKFEGWDARVVDIGTYCGNTLRLEWRADTGVTWLPFIPEPKERYMRVVATAPSIERLRQYLTEEDWHDLEKMVRDGYEPSLAATLLAQTHRLIDRENWREALIEGNTALELAIDERIRSRLDSDKKLLNLLTSRFNDLPLRIKLLSIGTFIDNISLEDINHTLEVIDMRNSVVHEGWEPTSPNDVRVALRGLVSLVTLLLPGPGFKFPTARQGNMIRQPEDWEKEL
jgi:hypothetical protein